jgi:hypothetical protein
MLTRHNHIQGFTVGNALKEMVICLVDFTAEDAHKA